EYKDYYNILGIARTANANEIKSAYRKLAMQYHPDRNPGDKQAEERFKDINEAYQVLSDSQKRARYDQLGESYSQWQQNGTPGNFNWGQWTSQPGAQEVNFDDLFGGGAFSDFFRTIFGGMGGGQTVRGRSSRGTPAVQQPVTISLREAYSGTTRTLQTGKRRVEVKLPAGARQGTKIRVPGAGLAGADGRPSDLYLVLDVAVDPTFERDGDDLHTQISIDVFKAILGGEVEVKTLSGNVLLTIPPGTQPDQVFRLAGRGMPQLKSPDVKGDLYVFAKVQIPKGLNAQQKSLLEQASKA
ncbi:MAG: J domain-containing protein, partial [Anaerolineales bacterium]